MAFKCSNCGGINTLALVNNFNCLDCGALTDFEGNRVASGIDPTGRAVIEKRLEPRKPGVVGNLADVQRAGSPDYPETTVGKSAGDHTPSTAAHEGPKADKKK